MSNMTTIDDWKSLSQVKVGSIIDVEDNERTVVQNFGIDLLLKTDGPFPTSYKALVEEFKDEWAGPDEEVYVYKEPESIIARSFASSLKQTLESRFTPQPVLTGAEKFKQELESRFGTVRGGITSGGITSGTISAGSITTAKIRNPFAVQADPTVELRRKLDAVAFQASIAESVAATANNRAESTRSYVDSKISNVSSEVASLRAKLEHQSLQAKINADLENQNKTAQSQGGNTMSTFKNLLGGFTNAFGKVANQFALSPVGLAVKAEPKNPFSTWVAYDKATGQLTDVQNLVFSTDVPAYQLPVNPSQVAVGDIVVNNGDYQYVVEVNDDYIATVCPAKRTRGSVLPVKNLFLNQSFYNVVKTLDLAGQAGFNPALLLAMGKGDKSELLPFLLMSGGINGGQAGQIDPMTLALLRDSADDILPFILMQQGGVTPQGFNPLALLLMSDKGGSKKDSLLPLLLMGQGGQGGAAGLQGMLPFLMLSDKGGDSGLKDILMMQAFAGQGGSNPFANLFGTPAAPEALKADTKKADK